MIVPKTNTIAGVIIFGGFLVAIAFVVVLVVIAGMSMAQL